MKPFLPFILLFMLPGVAEAVGSRADMVLVPAGPFQAGQGTGARTMELEAFYIDRYEVTQEQFEKVMGHNPSYYKDPRRPVEKVNWFDARDYCAKVGKRLPTEWEWEKAARAGTTTRYYWGEIMDDDYAWYRKNANQQTHPVGTRKPNAWGLYDMAGNVWEWTASDHSTGAKVLRGGSWRNLAASQRSAKRIPSLPHFFYHYAGFRCAASISR